MYIRSTATVNDYSGVFTIGRQIDDLHPRECWLRYNDSDVIVTGSYMGNYIMCQFPLQVGADLRDIPRWNNDEEDQPDCNYDSQLIKMTVWTKEVPGYSGTDYVSTIHVRFPSGEVMRVPIPYWAGKEIQRTAQGHCYKNGVKFS